MADGADVRALAARQVRGLLPPDLLQRKRQARSDRAVAIFLEDFMNKHFQESIFLCQDVTCNRISTILVQILGKISLTSAKFDCNRSTETRVDIAYNGNALQVGGLLPPDRLQRKRQATPVSHTRCFYSRFAGVISSRNPSIYHLSLLLERIS